MKKIFLWFVFLLCSCQGEVSIPSDREFVLKQTNPPITIIFNQKENRFAGFGGVNRYFGQYKTDGKKLTLSQVGATMMMGKPEDMETERLYFETLGTVNSFEITGKDLILKSPKKNLVFELKEN
ncbi:MAG: META domain-containing protein [Alphaproteobacteria bacterium]|nr:META domain-containing protein [Alphaproteobacteria bacterium]